MIGGSTVGDVLGWCLALFLLTLALLPTLRRNRHVVVAYMATTFVHIAAAAIYHYLPGILPTRADANRFHKVAIAMQSDVEWPIGISATFFKWYLAHVYSWIGASWFFASMLSISAFAFSVLILIKLMDLLRVQDGRGLIILFFGILPTAVLYGSVPMREPYQVLFFILACYCLINFKTTGNMPFLIAGVASASLMGLLHKGLIVYAPVLILLILAIRVDKVGQSPSGGVTWLHRTLAILFAIVIWTAFVSHSARISSIAGGSVLNAVAEDSLVDYADSFRNGDFLNEGRTSYGVGLDTSSPVAIVYSMTLIVFHYMFTPFPWQVRNFLDVYAFCEVVLRAATLVGIFWMWRRRWPVDRQITTLLMLVYVSMALLWAVGTTNYGTATRHHMVHQWILLVLGVPALLCMLYPRLAVSPATRREVTPVTTKALADHPLSVSPFAAASSPLRRIDGSAAAKPIIPLGVERLTIRAGGQPKRLGDA